jgi:molybdopterin molybdotransferase
MFSFDAALAQVLALGSRLRLAEVETVPLSAAVSRVLAEDITSPWPSPVSDYSAMDGYAVSTLDFPDDDSRALRVAGEARTGHATPTFQPGTAVRIFTGAAIPLGCDAVVIQENVQRDGELASFQAKPRAGQHIRRRGEDLAAGSLALAAGHRIHAGSVGLLGSLEFSDVVVRKKPRVGIVCTGDELRAPAGRATRLMAAPPPGLAESNSLSLTALVESQGAAVVEVDVVPDTPGALEQTLTRLVPECDVLVTVGGASVGDHDLLRPALTQLGAKIHIPKVAIKPGKPFMLAEWERKPIVGLPGNPSSAFVTFCLFGVPLLRALSGISNPALTQVKVPLGHTLTQSAGRTTFLRAKLEDGRAWVLDNQASGAVVALSLAQLLICVPEAGAQLAEGDLVNAYLLAGLGGL